MSTSPHHPPNVTSDDSGEARPWLKFVVVGVVLIVAGGFVAAAGGEDPSKHLSWASAYLVLVCGVAQLGLGGGRAFLGSRQFNTTLMAWQFTTFNVGNAGVLIGTLVGASAVLYAGSAVLLLALALFARDVRAVRTLQRRWVRIYWAFVIVLALSVPVGAVLGH